MIYEIIETEASMKYHDSDHPALSSMLRNGAGIEGQGRGGGLG